MKLDQPSSESTSSTLFSRRVQELILVTIFLGFFINSLSNKIDVPLIADEIGISLIVLIIFMLNRKTWKTRVQVAVPILVLASMIVFITYWMIGTKHLAMAQNSPPTPTVMSISPSSTPYPPTTTPSTNSPGGGPSQSPTNTTVPGGPTNTPIKPTLTPQPTSTGVPQFSCSGNLPEITVTYGGISSNASSTIVNLNFSNSSSTSYPQFFYVGSASMSSLTIPNWHGLINPFALNAHSTLANGLRFEPGVPNNNNYTLKFSFYISLGEGQFYQNDCISSPLTIH